MAVTTNYLVTGNGITGSTANAVQALVSGDGNALIRATPTLSATALASKMVVHRGSPFTFPEGSLSGLKAMYAASFRRFEIDCLLTYDGKLVWMHDPTVQRTCAGIGTASGATTNTAGYAIGATVISLAAVGSGTILATDTVRFGTDPNPYKLASGTGNVNGGSITLAAPGLLVAIPAAATAVNVGEVAALTAAEIKALTLSNLVGNAGGYMPEAPSLITEVLDWATDKDVEISFEAKSPVSGSTSPGSGQNMRALLAELRARNWPSNKAVFTSFVKTTADIALADGWRAFHQPSAALSNAEIDIAINGGYEGIFASHLQWTQEFVDRAKAGGLTTAAYTIDRRKDRDAMLALGIDIIVTDDPVYMGAIAPLTTGDLWQSRKYPPGLLGTANVNLAATDSQRGKYYSTGNWGHDTGGGYVGTLMGANCPLGGDPLSRSGDLSVTFFVAARPDTTGWCAFTFGMVDDGREQEAVIAPVGTFRALYGQDGRLRLFKVDTSGNGGTALGTAGAGTGEDLSLNTNYRMRVLWSDNGNNTSTVILTLYAADGTTVIRSLTVNNVSLVAGGYFALARKNVQEQFIPGTLTATA